MIAPWWTMRRAGRQWVRTGSGRDGPARPWHARAVTDPTEQPTAFYVPDPDGSLVASVWTRGPWDNAMQHGGPPSALMARAIERELGEEHADWVPVRTLVELLRQVPIARLSARASIETRGRKALRAVATLEHEGVQIGRARVIMVRATEEAPETAVGTLRVEPELPPPETWPPFEFSFFLHPVGYHRAMELRIEGSWPAPTARCWSRMRVPLVEGEQPSGWQRALCFADAAHGVAPGLDPRHFTLINPDLELSLARPPRGEWIGLDIRTATSGIGTGLTRSRVVDREGEVGATSATLVVRPRG